MNCKNCNTELKDKDKFCNNCGAKIVTERITIKSLFSNLLASFGWESNFFVTFRYLLSKPQTVLKEYINGTRKKYTNPFTFYAISLAISLFVFSQYSEQFIQMSISANVQQVEKMKEITPANNIDENKGFQLLGFKNQVDMQKSMTEFQLKNYNLISFLFIPFFTLIAFIVFRKPYNYGEQLVINTYILSMTTFLSVLLFIFSLITKINILFYALFFTFLYYSYVYKELYELSFGKLIVKTLKFLLIVFVIFVLTIIIGIVLAILSQ